MREKTELKRRNKIIINTKVIKDKVRVFFYEFTNKAKERDRPEIRGEGRGGRGFGNRNDKG